MRSQAYLYATLLIASLMLVSIALITPYIVDSVEIRDKRAFDSCDAPVFYIRILRNSLIYAENRSINNLTLYLIEQSDEYRDAALQDLWRYMGRYTFNVMLQADTVDDAFGKQPLNVYSFYFSGGSLSTGIDTARSDRLGIVVEARSLRLYAVLLRGFIFPLPAYYMKDFVEANISNIYMGPVSSREISIELVIRIRTMYYAETRLLFNTSDIDVSKIRLQRVNLENDIISYEDIPGVTTIVSVPQRGYFVLRISTDTILRGSSDYLLLRFVEKDGLQHLVLLSISSAG